MFETKRLLLRGFDQETDLNTFTQWTNDAATTALTMSGPLLPMSRETARQILQPKPPGENLPFLAICEKQEGVTYPLQLKPDEDYFKACGPAIGALTFMTKAFDFKNRVAYLGIAISDPRCRGKGYGREVLEWAMEYAFMELGLHRVALEVYAFNEGAIALYRKVGFVEEGRLRKVYFKSGEWFDAIQMAMLEEEWIELRKKVQK